MTASKVFNRPLPMSALYAVASQMCRLPGNVMPYPGVSVLEMFLGLGNQPR